MKMALNLLSVLWYIKYFSTTARILLGFSCSFLYFMHEKFCQVKIIILKYISYFFVFILFYRAIRFANFARVAITSIIDIEKCCRALLHLLL
jgi:hypothetical protein